MPQRLLLLITDLELGGTPTVVRELAIRLRRIDAQIEVACLSKWGPVADEIHTAGIPVTALDARGVTDFQILVRLLHLIRERQFTTVFSFLIHANTMAAAASLRIPGIRWLQAIQTTQPSPRWHWMMQRIVHRRADKIVVPSQSVANAAMNWSAIPADKLIIVPNAIDLADWEGIQSNQAAIRTPPYPITFLGRLDPIKDVPNLIQAVSLLRDLVHLHIYGEGEDRLRIEQAIQKTNAQVTLHGAVNSPQKALANSRLLVLPSISEGFGLVLIEAMAAGIPIVATDVPGIRDVITDGHNGLLVQPTYPNILANAIRTILEDPQLQSRLIANGLTDVRQRFTWDMTLPQYRSLLQV